MEGRSRGFVHGIARVEADAIDAKTPPQIEDYQRAQRVEILALKRLLFTTILASEQLLQGQQEVVAIKYAATSDADVAPEVKDVGCIYVTAPRHRIVGDVFAFFYAQGKDTTGKIGTAEFDEITGCIAGQQFGRAPGVVGIEGGEVFGVDGLHGRTAFAPPI